MRPHPDNYREGKIEVKALRATVHYIILYMGYLIHKEQEETIAELTADVTISNGQDFLDIVMNLPSDRVIIHKSILNEAFFELRSGVAGEILQKAANYQVRLAIVGDYSAYESKSLRDFIYESNKGNSIVFVSTLSEALIRLSA